MPYGIAERWDSKPERHIGKLLHWNRNTSVRYSNAAIPRYDTDIVALRVAALQHSHVILVRRDGADILSGHHAPVTIQ